MLPDSQRAVDTEGAEVTAAPDKFFLVEPWGHQRTAFNRAVPQRAFGLFFEMGAGKTMTAINILRAWMGKEKRVLRTLVLGPPIVVQNWKREFETHSRIGKQVFCLEGPGKKRLEGLLKHGFDASVMTRQGAVFVTNYESLLMKDLHAMLYKWQPEVIVFDESHKLKNPTAKRTKLATALADVAQYRLILTGTPILNTPMDIFSQLRVMDGGQLFGRNFFSFRAEYFYDKNAGMPKDKHFPLWLPREGSLDKMNAKIKPVSMVVKKQDCMDLPPLVRQEIPVELSKEQTKLYEAMKKDFIAYVNDKACVAQLAITKALRLQQIVSGFVTLEGENGGERTNVAIKDNPRALALRDLLEDITPTAKCLVWAVFRENYGAVRAVCEDLGIQFVEVHGEVPAAKRQAAVDAFNTDPNIKVFLGHPGSAGIGINLVAAPYSIFYSRTFSLEQDLQAEARNYRGGSEIHEKVTRFDLVAKGTIDEVITAKLAAKIDISDKVLRDIAGAI